jgi:hypothetical protein
MRHFEEFFEAAKTFFTQVFYVPNRERERERVGEREREQEQERDRERERGRGRGKGIEGRGKGRERENKCARDYISKPPGPKWLPTGRPSSQLA